MEDSFDADAMEEQHSEIIKEIKRIRDGLTSDVIDYYHKAPTTKDEEKKQHEGMRKYVEIAQERIHDLLNGKLY